MVRVFNFGDMRKICFGLVQFVVSLWLGKSTKQPHHILVQSEPEPNKVCKNS